MEEPFQIAGINRNILECKDYCFLSTLFRALVLIETYWNVKFSGTAESYIHSCVLIETYWNVKEKCSRLPQAWLSVLIETYWNVKKVTADLKAASAKY